MLPDVALQHKAHYCLRSSIDLLKTARWSFRCPID
jgi:hypothetical protein